MPSMLEMDSSNIRSIVDGWLASDILRYDPFDWASLEEALFRRKCFAELALYFQLADCTASAGDAGDSPAFTRLRAAVGAHLNPDLVSLAARNPNNILMFAGPLSLALAEGRLPPADHRSAANLLCATSSWGVERVPFRQLDLAASAQHAGLPSRLPVEALLQVSALAVPPDPASAGNEAFYALTHCALYAYGVMRRPPDAWLDRDALYASLEGCACRCLVSDDIDLGLELAAASALLGLPIGPAQRLLVAEVRRRIATLGVTRCLPSAAADTFMQLRPGEDWAREFHTMLVTAITFMILERTGAAYRDDVDDGDRLFVELLGNGLIASVRYDLGRAAEFGSAILASFDLGPDETRLLRFLFDAMEMGENADGSFGRLVDEHRLAALAGATPANDVQASDLQASDLQACVDAGGVRTSPSAFMEAYREIIAA